MILYHLSRIFRPALLLVLLWIAFVTFWIYRPGGFWTGDAMGYFIVLQYWSVVTPMLMIGLVASTPGGRPGMNSRDPVLVTRPPLSRVAWDISARFIALLVPIVLTGIVASLFLSWRTPDAINITYTLDGPLPDPLTVPTVWMVFLLGPLSGCMALLAVSEMAGTYLGNNLLRLLIAGIVSVLDMTNLLRSPLLSLSGTALGVVQTPVRTFMGCMNNGIETPLGEYCLADATWGQYIYSASGNALQGPITVDPDISLILGRLALVLLAGALLVVTAVLREREILSF